MADGIIFTQFYRTATTQDVTCQPHRDANYTPYLQYSLRNWLHYYIREKLSPDIDIDYIELPKDKKLYLTVVLTRDGKSLELTSETREYFRKKIQEISIRQLSWLPVIYFNTDVFTEEGDKLPTMWVNQVLNYINLNQGYQGYISNIGLMVNLERYPDYTSVQAALALEIKDTLVSKYNQGTVLLPPIEVVDNWKLKRIGEGLYQAKWSMKRIIKHFKSTTDFLISRIQGDTMLYLDLGPSDISKEEVLYLRFKLTLELYTLGFGLNDFIFTDDGIEISANDLDTSLIVLKVLDTCAQKLQEGSTSQIEYLPMVTPDEFTNLQGGVIYRVTDKERPYVYSNAGE